MKQPFLLLLLLSLTVGAIANTPICDPEKSLAEISNCIYDKRRDSQRAIEKAYNSAYSRVKNKSALAISQHQWYKNTKITCDKEINEGSLSGMNVDGCLYRHNLKRIDYLNHLSKNYKL